MKLIAVMSIEQYAGELRRLFQEHKVPVYSEMDIEGFKWHEEKAENANWFSHRHVGVYSHVVFAFVEAAKADELLEAIAQQAQADPEYSIRAFQLNVERSI